MGHLKEFRVPQRYSPTFEWQLIQDIRTALNTMMDTNFPENGLTGSRLVRSHTLPVNRLSGGEFHIPIIGLATAYTTTSTSWTNVGGIVVYDPAVWGDITSLTFDITGGPSGTGATASFRIIDSSQAALATIDASTSGYSRYTAVMTVPTTTQALVVQIKTSSSSVAVGIIRADIIVRP